MNKREEREHKFKLLFQSQFYEDAEIPVQLRQYFASPDYEDGESTIHLENLPPEKEEQLEKAVQDIVWRLPEIDAVINRHTEGWTTKRMTRTDLTALRLALYEIRYDEEVPEKVAINEAIEIARKYGSEDSSSFVNGVLGRILRPTELWEKKGKAGKNTDAELRQDQRNRQILIHRKK